MSIIRTDHNKENPYVMLNKTPLSDRNLSWAAKGLWSYLISKKDDWQVSVAHLQKIFLGKGGGRDAIYSLLDELIEQGYCEKKGQSQNTKGQFSSFEYIIYEFKIISPLTGSPEAAEPDTDLPDTDEPATSNKIAKAKNEILLIKEASSAEPAGPACGELSFSNKEKEDLNNFATEQIKQAYQVLHDECKSKTQTSRKKFFFAVLQRLLSEPKKASPQDNKAIAEKMKDDIIFIPQGIYMEVLNQGVEIGSNLGQNCPTVIKYTEKGFSDQLDSLRRKYKIVLYKEKKNE